jgi:CRISPR system Cascade subunit CasE
MSLYLSRLCLNPLFAPAIKLASNPESLHRKLLAIHPCQPSKKAPIADQPKTANVLFRVDTSEKGPDLLIQSMEPPDWDALELAPRALRFPAETKPLDPQFSPGQRLSFRLLTRPCIRKSGDFGSKASGKRKPGPRADCRTDEERLDWLRRKSHLHGFTVESVGLTLFSAPAIKSEVPAREKGGCFTSVRFDGVLVVTDPDKLREAVRNGIGPQKAYGFGLLSLAPLR